MLALSIHSAMEDDDLMTMTPDGGWRVTAHCADGSIRRGTVDAIRGGLARLPDDRRGVNKWARKRLEYAVQKLHGFGKQWTVRIVLAIVMPIQPQGELFRENGTPADGE